MESYVLLVHIFCKVDFPCCANWALRKASPKNLPNVKQTIERNFYMDYFSKLLSTVDELIELFKRVNSTLLSHGFRLTKWVSNSREILNSPKLVSHDLHSPTAERALGMIWNNNQDKLTFKPVTNDCPNTKHVIQSLVSSVFDTLGDLAPCFLEPKLILQELWKLKISWDEEIPKELKARWIIWKNEMINISHVTLDRWYAFENNVDVRVELNIFCDASSQEQMRISYFRTKIINKIHALCFIQITFIPSERTMFDYDFKIRTSSSRFSSQIKMRYFIGNRL